MVSPLQQYRWLTRTLSPALRLWCWARASRQPIYRPHRAQRWAQGLPLPLTQTTPAVRGIIWLHAVSVGETQACAPLLRALLAQYPHHAVLLTHMTPTGRDTGAQLFADQIAAQRVQQCYLPYDVAGLPERFLHHFAPQCGAMLETEVWPNWVAACAAAGVPLGLANARLSEQSLRRTGRSGVLLRLAQQTYPAFSWVAAQSAADAQRLAKLRPQAITVTGNLKFECSPNAAQLAQGKARSGPFQAVAGRTVIALASTREGEEALLLKVLLPWLARSQKPINNDLAAYTADELADTLANKPQGELAVKPPSDTPPLILLIPRHPKRAAELIPLLKQLGLSHAQRSAGQTPDADTAVYLCDTLGEMWLFYGAADIAIVGGGWLPTGGQNLIEPCAAGCAVIVGPHMYNFAHATALALAANAVVQCQSASATTLTQALDHCIQPAQRAALSQRAQQFAAAHSGATAKHLALFEPYLSTVPACQPNTASITINPAT